MFTDIRLWLAPSPGMFITVVGAVCFVAAFIFLIKTLRENMSGDTPLVNAPQYDDDDSLTDLTSSTNTVENLAFTEFIAATETEFEPAVSHHVPKYEREIKTDDITSYERVQLMFDVAPLIIQYWDSTYNLIDYNETAAAFYEIPVRLDEPISLAKFIPEIETCMLWQNYLAKAFEDGFAKFEYALQFRGKMVHLEVIARRIKAREKYVTVTYTSEITAEKDMLREKEERAIAEARSQAKTRFLAHMSHEIRTPISSVLGIAEIQLYNHAHSPEAKDAFRQIYNFSSTLTGILNDILDLSKIEAGKLEVVDKAYDVASLIQDVTQMHAVSLEHKKFKFKVNVDEKLPISLVGDELRIKQVLNNLLSNSFKYTENGMVQLIIGHSPSVDGNIDIIVKIIDTGRGMTQEQVNMLLREDYVRFDEESTPHVQGTGLGVSIVQSLLALMGGKMEISSTPDIGTNVTLIIPQEIANNAFIGLQTATRLEELSLFTNEPSLRPTLMPWGRVLVVDDMAPNLHVARGLLELFELQVETSLTAANVIDKIRGGEVYDIIFMDHMMPDIDGITATKILRDMGYTNPIIALSANAFVEQEQEFLRNGFDDFLAKPIKTAVLHELLLKYIKPLQGTETIQPVLQSVVEGSMDEYFRRPDVIEMIREDFIANQSATMAQIEEALLKDDFASARIFVHTTRNRALLLGEVKLGELAEDVERFFARGEAATNELLQNFGEELDRVLERLN